jgi:hypothetical protein
MASVEEVCLEVPSRFGTEKPQATGVAWGVSLSSAQRARARPLVECAASRAFFGWEGIGVHAIVAQKAKLGGESGRRWSGFTATLTEYDRPVVFFHFAITSNS